MPNARSVPAPKASNDVNLEFIINLLSYSVQCVAIFTYMKNQVGNDFLQGLSLLLLCKTVYSGTGGGFKVFAKNIRMCVYGNFSIKYRKSL